MKLTGAQVIAENYVETVDDKGNLKLYHYMNCNDSSTETLKQIRGIIIDSQTNSIVMRSFPYTQEFVGVNPDLPFLKENRKNTYFPSYEGTIIRVFWHGEGWHVSTHRRINAFESFWGGPITFGEFFKMAVENILQKPYNEFFELLNKDHQYIFLLHSTQQTRIVSPVSPYPVVSLVATVVNGEFNFDMQIPGFFTQKQLFIDGSRSEFDNIRQYMEWSNGDISTQGMFVVSTDEQGDQHFYKIVSPMYHSLSLIRGNAYDISTRFVELRFQVPERVNDFIKLFSEYTGLFMFLENRIDTLASHIASKYNARFVQGKYAPVVPALYPFMKKVREDATQKGRGNGLISREDVLVVLSAQSTYHISKMLAVNF